jgi:hypothetical protein
MSKVNFGTNPEILQKAHAMRETQGKRPVIIQQGVVQKYGQVLPENVTNAFASIISRSDRNNYIKALESAGWTATAIARSAKMSTESIRLISRNWTQTEHPPATLAVPLPERKQMKVKVKPVYTEPNPEMLARMKELQPLAALVRSHSPKYREEAEEYSYLLNEAIKQGCTQYRLAKLLGVTPSAIAFRLVRYGYKATVHGETKTYQPIMEKNRNRCW